MIRPVKLTVKLADFGVPTPTCNLILDFLTDRPQGVRMRNQVSAELAVSTGTPRGCCLSPKLYSLYINDCASTQENKSIIKYADDMTILGIIKGGGESSYTEPENLSMRRTTTLFSIDKTKTLIWAFRKRVPTPLLPLTFKRTEVERVRVSGFLSWARNTVVTVKKAQQQFDFLRLLKRAGLQQSFQFHHYVVW